MFKAVTLAPLHPRVLHERMLLSLQSQKAPEMVPSDALSETVFHWMLLFSVFVSSIGKNHVIFTLMYFWVTFLLLGKIVFSKLCS